MGNVPNRYETDGICRCYFDSKGTKNVCWTHWPFPIDGVSNRPPAIGMGVLAINKVVKTNYGTGPYRITKILGPCICPTYVDSINIDNPPPTREHYHLTCRLVGEEKQGDDYFLSHLDRNGRSVVKDKSLAMHKDYLIFLDDSLALEIGETVDMFAEAI